MAVSYYRRPQLPAGLENADSSMKRERTVRNAVIAAASFNPSVFREPWLRDTGLLDGELKPGFIFSDQIVSFTSDRFSLTVVQQHLQLIPNVADAEHVFSSVLRKVVDQLPHTPYTAAGFNVTWQIPVEGSMNQVSRRLFASSASPLTSKFNSDDAHFGLYMSKDVSGGARLRLDIKPIEGVAGPSINLAFNFQRNLSDPQKAKDVVAALCENWTEYERIAEEYSEVVERVIEA